MTPRARPATTPSPSPVVLVLLILGVAVLSAGCAGGRFVRPAGAPVPFPEGADIWSGLSSPCRSVSLVRAELRVSGRVGGQSFPSLTTGLVADADRLAIVAMHGARPVFNLAGERSAVVLLNHLDRTVTRGPAAEVVDALVGVGLEPDRLLALLSGCVTADAVVTGADRIGAVARIKTADSLVYLSERGGQWRLVAAEFDDVVADYRRIEDGWPREIELRRGADVTLRLRVIEFERNPQLPATVFQLPVPGTYVGIPLDQLRRHGPLGQREP